MIDRSKTPAGLPERCVMTFFAQVIADVCADAPVLSSLGSELGAHPVYQLDHDGQQIAVIHAGLGAPLSAALLEELIALGCRKFVACGGAGVLDSSIPVGHVVVPTSAVRDEGTSYHYLPPGREVAPSAAGVAAIEATLTANDIPYLTGKTWTTDAIYRETPAKIARRRGEGCLTVEMEAAAFFAVAQFREVTFAQLLYGGDDVGGDTWDHRGWVAQTSTREKLFWLAVESAVRL
ncbi:MAG: nucleoside phosphorylase [Chloroflexi bacterium]|nr:nucleoside phosphorylase [Chloroflexota bacterium]